MVGRPLSLLFPVECQATGTTDHQKQQDEPTDTGRHASEGLTQQTDNEKPVVKRPQRQAASMAREKIKEQLQN